MKKILITGQNSYVGENLKTWLSQWPDDYKTDTIDMKDDGWKNKSFSGYDAVFHVAGIAHSDTRKATEDIINKYFKINTELAIETAKKVKSDGVKQFIFMSSAIIYGESSPVGKPKIINKDTVPSPANFYGESKLRAEKGILPLQDSDFNTVIIRAPMIFGKGSKGNYPVLAKYACKLPFFPDLINTRSMLYIENLCEFIKLMIDNNEKGIFFPQNKEYVNTSELVKLIAANHGKKIFLTRLFNPAIKLLSHKIVLINKVFGNLCYDQNISEYKVNYRIFNLNDSISRTEK